MYLISCVIGSQYIYFLICLSNHQEYMLSIAILAALFCSICIFSTTKNGTFPHTLTSHTTIFPFKIAFMYFLLSMNLITILKNLNLFARLGMIFFQVFVPHDKSWSSIIPRIFSLFECLTILFSRITFKYLSASLFAFIYSLTIFKVFIVAFLLLLT